MSALFYALNDNFFRPKLLLLKILRTTYSDVFISFQILNFWYVYVWLCFYPVSSRIASIFVTMTALIMVIYYIRFEAQQTHYWYFAVTTLRWQNVWFCCWFCRFKILPRFDLLCLECESGKYGVNCQSTCGNCLVQNQCSHIDGVCSGGCAAGYTGGLCQTSKVKQGIDFLHICKVTL